MAPSSGHDAVGTIPRALWDAFFEGDRRACARLITLVENDASLAPEVRERLAGRWGRALRVGVTGPPGVGKSTLTAVLAEGLLAKGRRVGVLAVDPSSPFSGGAFMGDRVRMEAIGGNPDVFVRSMASRDGRGGLSPATPRVAGVLEGFGMDTILIETVGVGQAELDVLRCADLVVLVLQPSTGDAIQSLKAGILEASDLVVVNKADLPGADGVVHSLQFAYGLGSRPAPPIVAVSATRREGVDAALACLGDLAQALDQSGRRTSLRVARLSDEMRASVRERLWEALDEAEGAGPAIDAEAARLAATGDSPYPFVARLCGPVADWLRKRKRP